MADSFIEVLDGNAVLIRLDTDLTGGEHTPKHIVTSLPPLPAGANHIGEVDAIITNTVTVSDGGGSITVDGTVALGAGSADVGSVRIRDATFGPARLVDADTGAGTDPTLAVIAGFIGNGGFLTPATNTGTMDDNVPRHTLATNDPAVVSLAIMDDWDDGADHARVVGAAAADAAVSGNPVLNGFRASLNEPSAVDADGDAVSGWADRHGRQVVLVGHSNPELPVTVNATASGDNTVISAPGASLSLYICKGSVHNRDSANVVVALQDGAAGTIRWRAELAAEGGGSLFDFGSRGWKLTADTLLNAELSAAGNVDVNVTEYYIAA